MEKERSRRSGATSRGPPPVVVIAEPDAGPASGPLLEDYSGDVCVGRVGLLWRPGAGTCPNLPQRHPGPGSAAKKSAEYQRFFSRAPARSGPLWQIWTIRRRGPAGEGGHRSGDGPGTRLDNASNPAEPAEAPVRKGPRHPNRSQGASPIPGPRRDAPDFSRTRRFLVERVPPICAFD